MNKPHLLLYAIAGVLSLETIFADVIPSQNHEISTLLSEDAPNARTKSNSAKENALLQEQVQEKKFYSQASQDEFVYHLLYGLAGKKDQGYFLDIGAGDPLDTNNTHFFEKKLKWKGTNIDVATKPDHWYAHRNTPLLVEDATKSEFKQILEDFPETIDYLSLDTDGNYATILKRIPFEDHVFRIITIEHDLYRFGDVHRTEEREILNSLGYHLLCPDLSMNGICFEDWWIYPSAFPPAVLSKLLSLDLNAKEHTKVMEEIKKKHNSPLDH